jgi:KDO2-lipid IV(A) lauroyltransferase
MRLSKRIKRDAVVALIRSLVFSFNHIPRRLAVCVGAAFGLATWAAMTKERHKAQRHLSLAYGDSLTDNQKAVIGRNFFVNTGKNIADVIRFQQRFHHELKPLVSVEGLEHFDAAHKRGKGVIGITGHIGNFELLAAYIQSLGYKAAVIGRQVYDERLDQILVANREALGLTNISTTDHPRRIVEWLRAGNVIGALIDTDSIRVRTMFVPAFGRLANTPVGQTVIGLRTGAAFVPIACLRTPENGYRVVIKEEIAVEPSGDRERDIYEATWKCNQALEEIITEHKDQWIWLHNRWHTRPEESA